ncbi:MAG: DUF3617 family protein [Comamonadaceae bacterium]|nr:DUF3617 family protein [Comamonadaceae bacterium]
MNSTLKATLIWAGACVSTLGFAAPGEYWELTSKMEMLGMPMAMPSTTMKVCVPIGGERDPKYSTDKNCVVSDVVNSGNKTSWKVRCNHDGEIMTGSGEMSGTRDNAEGTMRMSGTSGGRKFDMTNTYKNKRIGGTCDTDELANKMKGQAQAAQAQMCDSGKSDLAQRISMGYLMLDEKTCPGKKQPFCESVRAEAPRDARIYAALVESEKNGKNQVIAGCGINIAATTQAICKTVNGNNANTLTSYCPAEVKVYRENARRKACEGRSFTAREDLSKCLRGSPSNEMTTQVGGNTPGTAPAQEQYAEPVPPSAPAAPSTPNPAETLMDSAKKLKGLFGF